MNTITLCRLLAAVAAVLVASPLPAQQQTATLTGTSRDAAPWVARLNQAQSDADLHSAARELAANHQTATLAFVRSAWPGLNPKARQALLNALTLPTPRSPGPAHPNVYEIIELAANDSDPTVRQAGVRAAETWAFRDFASDPAALTAWLTNRRGSDPMQSVRNDATRYAVGLSIYQPEDRLASMGPLKRSSVLARTHAEVREALIEGGILELWARWFMDPATDEALLRTTLELTAAVDPPQYFYDNFVYQLVERTRPTPVRQAAILAIAQPGRTWATPIITRLLNSSLNDPTEFHNMLWTLSAACARIRDHSTIPTLIAIINADNTHHSIYGVGHFGLAPLTGVKYDESHNGAWWTDWWNANRASLPENARDLELPILTTSFPRRALLSGDDIPSQDLKIGDDPNRRYILFGPDAHSTQPASGWGLVVVLPGGDGSDEFRSFVSNIAAKGVPDGLIVAQAVAPRWRDDADRIVWPTTRLPDDAMAFPTESFINAIITDVSSRLTIDPSRIYALGWSSGGPPVYTAAFEPDSPLRGAVVAMSVFKPELLPPIDGAKGRAFRILHSEADAIPIRMARQAVADLRAAGITSEITLYEGGHGWHGDAYGLIRRSFEWVEQQAAAMP